jgi:hypothetical protein
MQYREVTLNGTVQGYVRNDSRGVKVADDFCMEHVADGTASSKPVDRIPQKARRLDMDEQRSPGRSFR